MIHTPRPHLFLTVFQDVVSRFALDSATEFLFGVFVPASSPTSLYALMGLFTRDVRSLSAGLNYPPSAPVSSSRNHPANKFADAFLTVQSVIVKRSRLNELTWKLIEFLEDRIVEPMTVIGGVLDPIIENAIKKKGERKANSVGDSLEGETLLGHLVNLTDGEYPFRFFLFSVLHLPRPKDYPR